MTGMKILITRPRKQAGAFAGALISAGFEPLFFPVIEIQTFEENLALDRAIARLDCYDWIVFTSVNGVEAFFDRLYASDWHSSNPLGKEAGGQKVKIAAIGPKTAASLNTRGVTPDFVPEEFVAEAILPGLGDLRGRWVLLPRAEIARKALPDAINAAGGVAHEIAVYRTMPVALDPDSLAALKDGVDVVTFTSPSTVENFVEIVRQAGLDPLRLKGAPVIACIGPITQKAAQEAGYSRILTAEEFTTEGLIQLLQSV